MKKIISLVLTLILICTFCVPAFASDTLYIGNGKNKAISQGIYGNINIENSAKGTIENGNTVTMEDGGLTINGTLVIDGKLDGTVTYIGNCNGKIILGENGYFHLTFTGYSAYTYALRFIDQLKNSNITYVDSTDDSGNIVIAFHKHEFVTKTVTTCTGCDYYEEVVNQPTARGSIISQGYPEIVYGIGGIAIGVVVTLLISRKKKVAVSSTSAGNKE